MGDFKNRAAILGILFLTLAGCSTLVVPQVKITPTEYSKEFQKEAAKELSSLSKLPCARDVPQSGCSALRRMILDYKDERDKLKVLSKTR